MNISKLFAGLFFGVICAYPTLIYAQQNTPQEVRTLQVSYEGDLKMDCGELSREASLMRDIIFTTQDIKDDGTLKKAGIGVAGAIGSFLVGTVTGGIGIAAAGFVAKEANESISNDADDVQIIAKQRRTLMLGIYNAKGCLGPMDHALTDPEKLDLMGMEALNDLAPAAGDIKSESSKNMHINP